MYLDCQEWYFILLAAAVMFVGACHLPWGIDRTHGFMSTLAVISGALAVILRFVC